MPSRLKNNRDGPRSVCVNESTSSFASKVGTSRLDTVSTGSGSDLVNDGGHELLGNIAC